MDKIREALELGKSYVSQVLQDHDLKYDHHPATEADRAVIVEDVLCFDEALALLSAPVASDARDVALVLAHGLFEPSGEVRPVRDAFLKRAAAEIERYAAERERKALEETVDKCIDAVHTWMLRGQSGGEIGLIAKFNAIKEAGND